MGSGLWGARVCNLEHGESLYGFVDDVDSVSQLAGPLWLMLLTVIDCGRC